MRHWIILVWALMVALLAGCGGGGGGGGGSTNDGAVSLFATDDLNTNYDGVWVTVQKVQLRKLDDTFVTVMDDTDGRIVNLRALSDGSSLYAFWGDDGVPSGSYSGMRIILKREVKLYTTGSSNALIRQFDDVYGTANTTLDFLFSSAKTVGAGGTDIIVDFDLSQWEDVAGEIRNAICKEGNGAGFNDPNRHEDEDYKGRIADLSGTAPNYTFVLQTFASNKIIVETSSATTVFNNNGQPNPVLANAKTVEVRGKFNPSTGRLVADSIKIKASSSDDDDFEVKGGPKDVSTSGRFFYVAVRESSGFVPNQAFVKVIVNDATVYFTDRGVPMSESAFFNAILAGDGALEVEAEGSVFDSATQTLTAKKCKLDDEDSSSGGAEAKGTPSAINSGAGTFNIALTEWYGFSGSVGGSVQVITNSGTRFRNVNGDDIDKPTFFSQLAGANGVKVEGVYANGVITASEARIRTTSGGGGGGNDPAEAHGIPSNVNQSTRTFNMRLVSWEGFSGSPNQVITVTMTVSATYRDDEGESISESQFFSAMASGQLVEVEGTYNPATSTLIAIKGKFDDD